MRSGIFLSLLFVILISAGKANAQYVSVYDANGKLNSSKQTECAHLNELVKKAFNFFNSDIGALLDTKDLELYNGVSTKHLTYASVLTWRGSSKSELIRHQTIKNGVVRGESFTLNIYTRAFEYKIAEIEYRKLYNEINGCEITSPSGQTYTLRKDLDKPVLTIDGYMGPALVDFNQLFTGEKIDIALKFARDENGEYYSCISVSRSK